MLRTRIPGQFIQTASIFSTSFAEGIGVISSSGQIDYTYIQNQPTTIPTASLANAALFVLQQDFTGSFTGSFVGEGSLLTFETLNTYSDTDSVLIIGNIYNNYANRQTTIFQNGDVVVSGSVTISEEGVLLLKPRETPDITDSGTLFYSSSGELYLNT